MIPEQLCNTFDYCQPADVDASRCCIDDHCTRTRLHRDTSECRSVLLAHHGHAKRVKAPPRLGDMKTGDTTGRRIRRLLSYVRCVGAGSKGRQNLPRTTGRQGTRAGDGTAIAASRDARVAWRRGRAVAPGEPHLLGHYGGETTDQCIARFFVVYCIFFPETPFAPL